MGEPGDSARPDLGKALTDAIDDLHDALDVGADGTARALGSLIAAKSPAEEAADLVREADGWIDSVNTPGPTALDPNKVIQIQEARDRVKSVLDAMAAAERTTEAATTEPATTEPATTDAGLTTTVSGDALPPPVEPPIPPSIDLADALPTSAGETLDGPSPPPPAPDAIGGIVEAAKGAFRPETAYREPPPPGEDEPDETADWSGPAEDPRDQDYDQGDDENAPEVPVEPLPPSEYGKERVPAFLGGGEIPIPTNIDPSLDDIAPSPKPEATTLDGTDPTAADPTLDMSAAVRKALGKVDVETALEEAAEDRAVQGGYFLRVLAVLIVVVLAVGLGAYLFSGALLPGPAESAAPGSEAPGESNPVAGGSQQPSTGTGGGTGTAACDVSAAVLAMSGGQGFDDAALCAAVVPDPVDDRIYYNGKPAVVDAATGDITGSVLFEVTLTPDVAARLAGLCTSNPAMHCHGENPAAGEYVGFAVILDEVLANAQAAFVEVGLGARDETIPAGGKPKVWEQQPGDPFTANNSIWTLRYGSTAKGGGIYGPFWLNYVGTAAQPAFYEQPGGTFDFAMGKVVVGFIPAAEWDGVTTYRFFSYYALDDDSQSGTDFAPNDKRLTYTVDGAEPHIDLH